jgi:DnaJ domain
MTGDGSAFAALGLEPDADSSEIEQAYRRLIKQHHPDREGGDARRAAEINRAYGELRGQRSLKDPLELHEEWPLAQPRGSLWMLIGLLIVATGAVSLLSQSHLGALPQLAQAGAVHGRTAGRDRGRFADREPMELPLHLGVIDEAAGDALRLSRTRDEMALAQTSGDCHRLLRSTPTLLQLDRCAAFDDAVVQLEDRDPLRDQGPFAQIAVTGRSWSGASALSQDSLAIDARLDRIRMRVESALAPMRPVEPPEASAARSSPQLKTAAPPTP